MIRYNHTSFALLRAASVALPTEPDMMANSDRNAIRKVGASADIEVDSTR